MSSHYPANFHLHKINVDTALRFRTQLLEELNPPTAKDRLYQINRFCKFLFRRRLMAFNPFEGIRIRHTPAPRTFLTEEDLQRIINLPLERDTLLFAKDLYLFSCFTGLSYSEIARLKFNDLLEINENQWIIKQRKKTGTLYNVYLYEIPLRLIQKYRTFNSLSSSELIFGPLPKKDRLNTRIRKIAQLAHIDKHLSFHTARHTFATLALTKGVPIETVSKMLGHTNIKTTQIYGRIIDKKVEEDMRELGRSLSETFNTEFL